MNKVCPIMSRPAIVGKLKLGSLLGFPLGVLNGELHTEIHKVRCLESECRAWEEPCAEESCEGCPYHLPDVPGECYAKNGHCRMCEGQ